MAHRTKITGYDRPANNLFTVIIHCCGEHEHRHTMGPLVMNDPEKLASSIEWAHQEAMRNHEAALTAEAKLKAMLGSQVEHS